MQEFGLTWIEKKPKNSHFPVTSAFLNITMQNSMSWQQIIIMMQCCISTYIPLQSPSSSFYVWYYHFPSLGLTKQLISLSLLLVHTKTQTTEAKKKLENKSKERLIFWRGIHVAHTIKIINPKEKSLYIAQTSHMHPYHHPGRLLLSQGYVIKHYSETFCQILLHCHSKHLLMQQLSTFWSNSLSLL